LLSVLALPDFRPPCVPRPGTVFASVCSLRVRLSSRQPDGRKVESLLFSAVIPIPPICILLTRSLPVLAFVMLMQCASSLKKVQFGFVIWFHSGHDSIATRKVSSN
jgi:hypothetical protein